MRGRSNFISNLSLMTLTLKANQKIAAWTGDRGRGGRGDLVPTMPGCLCPKVNDMGPFVASRE